MKGSDVKKVKKVKKTGHHIPAYLRNESAEHETSMTSTASRKK
ncbi:MAG: hypothetical protein VZQ98_14510 [Bacteroidales bacterium]|nr:hypothetical protein [Bacteroidales bacterium]